MKLIQKLCCMNILVIKYFISYFHVILNTFVRFQNVNMQLFAQKKLFFHVFYSITFQQQKVMTEALDNKMIISYK